MTVPDIASEFAKLDTEDERTAFVAGVMLTYSAVFDALAKAMNSDPFVQITRAFVDIRAGYDEATAMVAVEGVL